MFVLCFCLYVTFHLHRSPLFWGQSHSFSVVSLKSSLWPWQVCKLWIFNEARGINWMSPDPLRTGGGLGTRLISASLHLRVWPYGTLPNYFWKISIIMTLSLGPLPPLFLASWEKFVADSHSWTWTVADIHVGHSCFHPTSCVATCRHKLKAYQKG